MYKELYRNNKLNFKVICFVSSTKIVCLVMIENNVDMNLDGTLFDPFRPVHFSVILEYQFSTSRWNLLKSLNTHMLSVLLLVWINYNENIVSNIYV
jgi:hypothetical protein